ncbi:MAG: NADH-quinone oxidoreductase subunit NuoE [Deltaproteobacteria bacterium]|nr:NADH-quinone oxidoreductase subunit NuoE [Deltaproteobacteria bacterium]
MLPKEIKERLQERIRESETPREQTVTVMYALQRHYGYLSDEAVLEAADLLHMTPLEIDELATFYDFIYREPLGEYVIHLCDSSICWMHGEESVMEYLCKKLGVAPGETTADGLFTILPACCLGYCDHAPAMLINGKPYGPLTPDSIDNALDAIRRQRPECEEIK